MQDQGRHKLEWALRLLLSIGSCLVGLYAIEFLLPVMGTSAPQDGQSLEAAERLGYDVDRRDMYEYIQDMQADGKAIVPAFSPEVTLNDFLQGAEQPSVFPLSGVANVLTAGRNESGDRRTYISDQYGFNNPNSVYSAPVDIALIGDSYTAGVSVREDEEIAAHVRAAGYNVLNLGSNANGPLIELGTLIEYAKPEKPPVVVWLFYEGNDLYNLSRERQHPLLISYLNEPEFHQQLIDRQAEVDDRVMYEISESMEERAAANEAVNEKENSVNVVDRLRLTGTREILSAQLNQKVADNIYVEADENIVLFASVLKRADEVVSEWGGELYFVYLPMYQRFASNDLTVRALEERRLSVLKEVRGLGIASIDMTESFEQAPDPLQLFPFGLFGHYNAAGYRVVADEILADL